MIRRRLCWAMNSRESAGRTGTAAGFGPADLAFARRAIAQGYPEDG